MDKDILEAIESLRTAGKRIEAFHDVLVICLTALTSIARKMSKDGLDDSELKEFEEFIDVVKAAIEYEKECRETAYNTHIDSNSSHHNQTRI